MMIYFGEQKECYINQRYRDLAGAQVPFPDFGSTDCKNGCGSHLLFLKSEGLLNLSVWGKLYIGGKSQSEYLLLCKSKPGLSVKILHRRDVPDARIT
ncbi:MAG: hypothetical protein A2Y94_00325 [Caldithrix sp. RBG_13_44_9]|nr:MAG: hypothetical protein A2Y94_00325 [Caldithrix sp. RBG_13_44_9]